MTTPLYFDNFNLRYNSNLGIIEYNSGAEVWLPASLSLTPGALPGTTTNDNAPAGDVGEYIANHATNNTLPNGSYIDLTSISLTAGDWDVSVICKYDPLDTTTVAATIGVSTTSGNSGTGLVEGVSKVTLGTDTFAVGVSLPSVRFSLALTTTIYLKLFSSSTGGTGAGATGGLTARRAR